jgi:hypothetical protein
VYATVLSIFAASQFPVFPSENIGDIVPLVAKQIYRLNIATMGIQAQAIKPSTVVIPVGAILERLREENGLTTCAWEGREVQLFSYDLQERAVRVGGAGQ